jgi:hypothetical protein
MGSLSISEKNAIGGIARLQEEIRALREDLDFAQQLLNWILVSAPGLPELPPGLSRPRTAKAPVRKRGQAKGTAARPKPR